MKLRFCYLIITLFTTQSNFAQISPPGLGKANTASWVAIGAIQDLNQSKTMKSMSYIGFGSKSNPDNFSPVYKPQLLVANQEFFHQKKSWKYSYALSYRLQEEYSDTKPYLHSNPDKMQEFRIYSRIAYNIAINPRLKIIPTFRQEFRRFLTTGFKNNDEIAQLRTRVKLQASYNINESGSKIIAGIEQLFASGRNLNESWSKFKSNETRFSIYYSYTPEHEHFSLNIGYMNDFVEKHSFYDVHVIAADLIFNNPFSNWHKHHRHI